MSHVEYAPRAVTAVLRLEKDGTDGRTDGRQTVTLRFPLRLQTRPADNKFSLMAGSAALRCILQEQFVRTYLVKISREFYCFIVRYINMKSGTEDDLDWQASSDEDERHPDKDSDKEEEKNEKDKEEDLRPVHPDPPLPALDRYFLIYRIFMQY